MEPCKGVGMVAPGLSGTDDSVSRMVKSWSNEARAPAYSSGHAGEGLHHADEDGLIAHEVTRVPSGICSFMTMQAPPTTTVAVIR